MATQWANCYWLLETQHYGPEYSETLIIDMVIASQVPSEFKRRAKEDPENIEIGHKVIFRDKIHTNNKWYILGHSEAHMIEIWNQYPSMRGTA